jgi:hypothetical protein
MHCRVRLSIPWIPVLHKFYDLKALVMFLIIFFNMFSTSAQNLRTISVGIDEYTVLYRGYPNLIGTGNYRLVGCENCSYSQKDTSGLYEVKPGNAKFAVIKLGSIEVKDGDTIKTSLLSRNYQVRRLPQAQLFLNDKADGSKVNEFDSTFSVSYGPGIPLEVDFTLVSWVATLSGDTTTYKGSGEELTPNLLQAVAKAKKRSLLEVEGYYHGGGAYAIRVRSSFQVK